MNTLMNIVWPVQVDPFEQAYHAISLETVGEKDLALACMNDVAQRNPLDTDIRKLREEMIKRIGK